MNAMASFIQTCFKIGSKVKTTKNPKSDGKRQPGREFCKSVSDPALNLIIINKSQNGRREKSFSVSEDLVLKGKLEMSAVEIPDTDDAPTTPPCDLLAQLDPGNVAASEDCDDQNADNTEVNEEMSSSFFDNNGNPVDDEEDEGGQVDPKVDPEPEPIYFINAATLSEEEFPVSLPSSEAEGAPNAPKYSPSNNENLHFHYEGQGQISNNPTATFDRPRTRPRVPISKSFPDIIQTTMADIQNIHIMRDFDFNNSSAMDHHNYRSILPRDTSGIESLAADSLEELTITGLPPAPPEKRNSLSIFNRMSTPSESDMTALTESFAGISGEKPPESWVIDFNSLSLENLDSAAEKTAAKSSNSNSLSFFVKMDDPLDDSLSETSSSIMSAEKKKIFSMFVDIGQEDKDKAKMTSMTSNPIPINKPVKNIVNTSSESSSGRESTERKFRYPSPKVMNRGPCENTTCTSTTCTSMKKQVRTAVPEVSQSHQAQGGSNNVVLDNILQRQGQDPGSLSNRSSLHVPNETENSIITSSLLSSMETTLQEEMEICQGGPCFKLGMDLLRMFQEEINTDVNISVRGRWVRAHKCILASRSQYFAAILSGNWVERAGNTINLDEFSYNVVQFTMYHIYSGTNEIPDTIDLIELASLTDLLGLEGLREVISQTIRAKFCHNFHRPCTGCISGILECFPLAINYGMEDLHRKMTKWICKHFVRVWPTKAFANLGDELIEKCLRYSVNHLSPENLLDITLGCDQLLSTMPTVRWTELIFSVVNQLSEACVQFVGENLSQVLQSQRFIQFGKGQSWNISRIESTFFGGILLLKPDEACLSHVALSRLIELGTETIDEVEWSTSFVDFLKDLRREVEKYIMANASRSVLSKNWEYLGQDVRKRICSTSFLGMDKHGNKIQKGPPGGTKANLQSRDTRESMNNKNSNSTPGNSKARPLSSGATSSRRSSSRTMEPIEPVAPVERESLESHGHAMSDSRHMKSVASVRPMPSSQVQRNANVFSDRKVTNVTRAAPAAIVTTSSPMAARMPVSISNSNPVNNSRQPQVVHQQSQPAALRNREREREKSFETSSRGASTTSTLSRPTVATVQTPMTPSRANQQQFPPVTKTSRIQKQQQQQQPPPPPQPAKPQFLTNSEKAKAVSRPHMQLRGSRSNSVSSGTTTMNSSYCRQSSLGTTVTAASQAQATPRTPNLSQPSRYASTLKAERGANVKPSSPLPTPKATTRQPHRTSTVTSSNVRKTGNTTRLNGGIKPSPTPQAARNNTRVSEPESGNGQQHGMSDFVFGASGPSSTSDGLMTKSSIEMDTSGSSGEPKMRTLAEIGRSSTFSKDEPTILGKMDISLDGGYNHF